MSLRLLLDENMSQVVASQIQQHRPDLVVESVHIWRSRVYEGRSDRSLLQAARTEGLTLVTYDQKTIPPLLTEMYDAGESHAGIVFVDERTIPSKDFGKLTRALIFLWEQTSHENWQNRVRFLKRPT